MRLPRPYCWTRRCTRPPSFAAAARDAVIVQRLNAAGAIIMGKTNVPVMLSDWQTFNPIYGVTNNPWDTSRTPGGSSGGAAAALAAGMTALEFGSDLAGSLRIPASFCGVFAHRPSHGLVPMRGFAPPGVPRDDIAPKVDQSVLGPMARSASDLMLALDIIAGPDADDAIAYRLQLPPSRATEHRDFRVLVLDQHPLVPTAESIRMALAELATQLEHAGCEVARKSELLPDVVETCTLFIELLMAFSGADMPQDAYDAAAKTTKAIPSSAHDFATAATRGTTTSHRDLVQADRHRYALAAQWRRLFEAWDVVLCPTTPVVAFAHDNRPFEKRTLNVDGKSVHYGMLPLWAALPTPTGQPVTSMPIGRDKDGLPIGMQIIGPRLEDRTTIAFAGLVERLRGGFERPPL